MQSENERYFPQHRIEKEIGLAEYNFACARLTSSDESITWATNTTTLIATAATFAALETSKYSTELQSAGTSSSTLKSVILVAILIFSALSIVHISYLHKSRTFASRKVIVIRRMLGLSYGEQSLVLPNWRVEGADNPFAIKMFPGFISYRSFPVHMVLAAAFVSINILAFEITSAAASVIGLVIDDRNLLILSGLVWYIFGLAIFRFQLRETDENTFLWAAKAVAWLLRVPLTTGINTVIYGIRLDIAEAKRIHADFTEVEKFSVFLEDGEFFYHRGINWKGVTRALLSKIRGKFSGGGSSISQQFARSNFITKLTPTIRRKIVEMLLARWIESVWNKRQILEGYLVTVRFEKTQYGFHRAFKYFFDRDVTSIEPWEAFILIERLGNVKDSFLGVRVREQLIRAIKGGFLNLDQAFLALNYYDRMTGHLFTIPKDQLSPAEVRRQVEKIVLALKT